MHNLATSFPDSPTAEAAMNAESQLQQQIQAKKDYKARPKKKYRTKKVILQEEMLRLQQEELLRLQNLQNNDNNNLLSIEDIKKDFPLIFDETNAKELSEKNNQLVPIPENNKIVKAPVKRKAGRPKKGEEKKNMDDDVFIRPQDRLLPKKKITQVIMKALGQTFKSRIAEDLKALIQECCTEFIMFIWSEAVDRVDLENRTNVVPEDIMWAFHSLGLEHFCEPLQVYITRYRQFQSGELEDSDASDLESDVQNDESNSPIPMPPTKRQKKDILNIEDGKVKGDNHDKASSSNEKPVKQQSDSKKRKFQRSENSIALDKRLSNALDQSSRDLGLVPRPSVKREKLSQVTKSEIPSASGTDVEARVAQTLKRERSVSQPRPTDDEIAKAQATLRAAGMLK